VLVGEHGSSDGCSCSGALLALTLARNPCRAPGRSLAGFGACLGATDPACDQRPAGASLAAHQLVGGIHMVRDRKHGFGRKPGFFVALRKEATKSPVRESRLSQVLAKRSAAA